MRVPHRSAAAPPTGASSIGMTAIGSRRRPASSGPAPSPACSRWVTRNSEPKSAAWCSSATAFARAKALLRNRGNGATVALGPRLSSSRRAASTTASPTGTTSQKTDRHPANAVSAPPTSGPDAAPAPPIAPHAPSTAPRRPWGVAAVSRVRDRGAKTAAPTPWTVRAATRTPTVGARAAAVEPSVNTAMPTVNIRRRPNRSPRAAPPSRSAAKARV